jgi:hypothetical protein
MRLFLAGLLILILPTAAWAQAKGQVLSVGFNNRYRPDCWTPMLIQLQSQSEQSTVYQIQIIQEDLDRDKVVFTQEVTLGGNVEGKSATTENFWVYFRPKPTGKGLPDASQMTNLNNLNAELKVFLCDRKGKQISTLPLTATINSIDPYRESLDPRRSRKLVLVVTDGADKARFPDYSQQRGVVEDVEMVPVQPRDLPLNSNGYEAVDGIVWMDADANFLKEGTRSAALDAIHQWVHDGGHLVVCQPPEARKIEPFKDLLPVGGVLDNEWAIPIVDRKDVDILNQIAHPNGLGKPWPAMTGPFKVARVPLREGSNVFEWMPWTDNSGTTFTPYLARRGYGTGACTWIAQDLGSPALTNGATSGWRFIWDRVFDWNNAQVDEDYKPSINQTPDVWGEGEWVDLGRTTISGLDNTNKAAWLISIACFFFVVYVLVAGPGVYFFLLSRGRAQQSWFYFGLSAVVATGLTVLLVKAVVRGPPELKHFSISRFATGDANQRIDSRFGLYIPQDGPQQIELNETSPSQDCYITPFAIHPEFISDDDTVSAYSEYEIPVRDTGDSQPLAVSIPYRSTSKKLETKWVGKSRGQIEVAAGNTIKLTAPATTGGYIHGTLTNNTGSDLMDIYLAFKGPDTFETGAASVHDVNWMLYLPQWPSQGQLKIEDMIKPENLIRMDGQGRKPRTGTPAYGKLERGVAWDLYFKQSRENLNSLDYALPMLALFEQLPPWRSEIDSSGQTGKRFELYRRNARGLDLSTALSAGQLVIVGTVKTNGKATETPLPVPLMVDGNPVAGNGTEIIEQVIPLDRSAVDQPPANRPTTTRP